ncbi:MAG: hypothetical protein Q9166_006080 [cf. Caloplaca sp. 2 TL-2023]
MSPSVLLDNSSDFQSAAATAHSNGGPPRILLLSPPSLASHPEKLNEIVAAHDRSATDIQMLDRLSLSLVDLPESTYDIVLILLDANQTRTESSKLLTSSVLPLIVRSLKPGGTFTSQDGTLADTESPERSEAIFAGLVIENGNMVKPNHGAESVPLRLGKQKVDGGAAATTSPAGTGAVSLNLTGKRKNGPAEDTTAPAGVGFVLPGDDLDRADDDDEDDELIDEDELLSEDDMKSTVVQPVECRPKPGKRRRACKDCTCGLAQRLEAEDAAKRNTADQQLAKLKAEELSEVDFTVQGKVGSCGNCALGDAFRCDGCPYIGQPAFKPGEEVKIANEVQL